MFGTVVTNGEKLTKEEKSRYMAFYCGLCSQLEKEYGSVGVQTLNYDTTFLALLLTSLYQMEEKCSQRRCVPKPGLHTALVSPATCYAADMNILLAYYQCLDDWQDDHNLVAKATAGMLEKYVPEITKKYPDKVKIITSRLSDLAEMERHNELNPDLPANCFGELMGELFVWQQDGHAPLLHQMGAALGRFIYLLDAVNDLKQDIKKQRYNPLVAQMDTDYLPLLTMMMGECTQCFEALPIEKDIQIMRNILYSGVWQNYKLQKRKTHGE